MTSDEIQYRVHKGDRDAFKTLYNDNAREVYLRAYAALPDENCAREAVKRVFSSIYRELRAASGPMDLSVRIRQLTDDAIADLKINALPAGVQKEIPQPAAERIPAQAAPPAPAPLPPEPRREEPPAKPKHKRKAGNGLLTLCIILLTLLVLWLIAGVLMDIGLLPFYDLGFRWFNTAVYPLFSLEAAA